MLESYETGFFISMWKCLFPPFSEEGVTLVSWSTLKTSLSTSFPGPLCEDAGPRQGCCLPMWEREDARKQRLLCSNEFSSINLKQKEQIHFQITVFEPSHSPTSQTLGWFRFQTLSLPVSFASVNPRRRVKKSPLPPTHTHIPCCCRGHEMSGRGRVSQNKVPGYLLQWSGTFSLS